jgi:hypothetical protein
MWVLRAFCEKIPRKSAKSGQNKRATGKSTVFFVDKKQINEKK